MRTISIAVVLVVLCPLSVSADELTADEQAVWDRENTYWEYVKNNDIPGYRSLWNERFVGWPGFSRTPMGKENIHGWIAQFHVNPAETYDYKLTPMAVRAFGDIVVAHYLVVNIIRSAETGKILRGAAPDRIAHTWLRRGDTWQIITGMSGTLISEEDTR